MFRSIDFFDIEYLLLCLFGVFNPTRELFTLLETSPLEIKGCKCLPMLGTHGSEGSLACLTYCDTGIRLLW